MASDFGRPRSISFLPCLFPICDTSEGLKQTINKLTLIQAVFPNKLCNDALVQTTMVTNETRITTPSTTLNQIGKVFQKKIMWIKHGKIVATRMDVKFPSEY